MALATDARLTRRKKRHTWPDTTSLVGLSAPEKVLHPRNTANQDNLNCDFYSRIRKFAIPPKQSLLQVSPSLHRRIGTPLP